MYDHILIPVVPDHAAEFGGALTVAKRMRSDGGKISALAVLEEMPGYVDAYIPPDTREANIKSAHADLEKHMGDAADCVIREGNPSRSILNWAEKNGVDCIIVPSHKPGFSDYFLGSTAARVVRHASCSVIVLR